MAGAQRIEILTSLRGIAALCVVLFHYRNFFPTAVADFAFADHWYVWVDLFFVLSGFVIFHAYGSVFKAGWSGLNYRSYMGARFARIYPVHLLALMCVLMLDVAAWGADALGVYSMKAPLFGSEERSLFALLTNLLLVHGLGVHDTGTWNGPSWSISCEFAVYLIFPWLLGMMGRCGRAGALLVIAGCWGAIAWMVAYHAKGSLDITYDWAIFRCLAGFVAGMAVYRLWQMGLWAGVTKFASWGVAVCFVLASLGTAYGLDAWVWGVFPPMIWLAVHVQGRALRFWESRVLLLLGEWSYALYLMHIPVLLALRNAFGIVAPGWLETCQGWMAWGGLAVVLLVNLMVAALVYRFYEMPARGWLRQRFMAR